MKKTKIVCTIGPSSESPDMLRALMHAGMNVCRLNFSHGSYEEHGERIRVIKDMREELDMPVAILLDTKGPEIRTGKFENDGIELAEGQEFTLTTEDCLGNARRAQVSYKGLPGDVKAGDRILIDDGLIGMVVQSVEGTEIHCRVLNGGPIKNNKGINLPGVKINLPAITEKDVADIEFGIRNGIDFIAASFVRKATDVLEIRKVLEENGVHDIHIISKIENEEGVHNIDEILEVSDGIMVARGDLGVEVPTEQVPIIQKDLIRRCNRMGKPVITATQMLDSMMRNPRPTRAETTDVANAIFDGTDAIMLSGETAAGKYPLESVRTMSQIALAAEATLDYQYLLNSNERDTGDDSVTFALSHATCTSALELNAQAILTATASGFTARKLAKFRPKAPIVAATSVEKVRRKLSLVWGVSSVSIPEARNTDEVLELALNGAEKAGYIVFGDLVVITAGVPVGIAGATNLMKVHIVGELLMKGTGVGRGIAVGRACIARNAQEAQERFRPGDVLVTTTTDKDMIPFIEKACALVVEEGGYTSHAAITGLSLTLPTVVGVSKATRMIQNQREITVDAAKGIVYGGSSRVI